MIGTIFASLLAIGLLYLVYLAQRWVFSLFLRKEERDLKWERRAVLWGALATPFLCLAFSFLLVQIFGVTSENAADFGMIEGVLLGPLYEEALKGLAPLAALFMMQKPSGRKLFVIGALSGLGFFMTETALSFIIPIGEHDAGALSHQIVMRGMALSFLHPLSTGLVGLGLGLAATASNWALKIFFPLVGFICGSGTHILNNAVGEAINRGEQIDQSELFGIHLTILIGLLIVARIRIGLQEPGNAATPTSSEQTAMESGLPELVHTK